MNAEERAMYKEFMQLNRKRRLYGLFARKDGKWVRMYPSLAFDIERARRVFQDALMASAMGLVEEERSLRPVKEM